MSRDLPFRKGIDLKQIGAAELAVWAVAAATAFGLPSEPLGAQTAISADGVIESTAGGFKFPDGTVQLSAASPRLAPVEQTGQKTCYGESGPTLPSFHPFIDVLTTNLYWTSTTIEGDQQDEAWGVSIEEGHIVSGGAKSVTQLVWPVRDER